MGIVSRKDSGDRKATAVSFRKATLPGASGLTVYRILRTWFLIEVFRYERRWGRMTSDEYRECAT